MPKMQKHRHEAARAVPATPEQKATRRLGAAGLLSLAVLSVDTVNVGFSKRT